MMTKTNKIIKRVAFFGDADAKEKDSHFKLAKKAAYLLAKEGYIIVNGGGPGVMLASTLGAKEAGGRVELSVVAQKYIPGNFEGRDKTNSKLADKIYEMAGYENRLNKLIDIADAFVIFKGGTGTIAEVGMVWSKAKFDFGNHEPLIFVGKEWARIIPEINKDLKLEGKEIDVCTIVKSAEEVRETLIEVGSSGKSR